jgi:hypothetical protein
VENPSVRDMGKLRKSKEAADKHTKESVSFEVTFKLEIVTEKDPIPE